MCHSMSFNNSILTNCCTTTNIYAGPVWYNFIQGSIGNNVDVDVEIAPPTLKRVSISISIITYRCTKESNLD